MVEKNDSKLSVDISQLSEKEKADLLTVEYNETGELIRHYGRQVWYIGTIFIPISFVCFIIFEEVEGYFIKSLVAVASNILIWLWLFLGMRMRRYLSVSYKRAREIESVLGFNIFISDTGYSPIFRFRTRLLMVLLTIIITCAWLIRLIICFYPCMKSLV